LTRATRLVALVALLGAIAVIWLWTAGTLQKPPTAAEQASVAALLRAEAPRTFEGTTTAKLERLDVVFGRSFREGPFGWLPLDYHDYQYAARYSVPGSDAQMVVIYPIGVGADDVSQQGEPVFDEVSLSVLNAYSKLSSAPLVAASQVDDDARELLKPGDSYWELFEYDSSAGGSQFWGEMFELLRRADGSISVIPQVD
jgi:hypothetical protein